MEEPIDQHEEAVRSTRKSSRSSLAGKSSNGDTPRGRRGRRSASAGGRGRGRGGGSRSKGLGEVEGSAQEGQITVPSSSSSTASEAPHTSQNGSPTDDGKVSPKVGRGRGRGRSRGRLRGRGGRAGGTADEAWIVASTLKPVQKSEVNGLNDDEDGGAGTSERVGPPRGPRTPPEPSPPTSPLDRSSDNGADHGERMTPTTTTTLATTTAPTLSALETLHSDQDHSSDEPLVPIQSNQSVGSARVQRHREPVKRYGHERKSGGSGRHSALRQLSMTDSPEPPVPTADGGDMNGRSKSSTSSSQSSSPRPEVDLTQSDEVMEEIRQRMSQFEHITENHFTHGTRNRFNKQTGGMECDCTITREDINAGRKGCMDDCLNRLLMIECGSSCPLRKYCGNKKFQNVENAPVEVFKTEWKGFGVRATKDIPV
jgi:hypothetical protein